MARKKICKIIAGSHLYGTNNPQSDKDYFGVFLPSRADLLGLGDYPREIAEHIKASPGLRNTSADVDCKYFALSKFIKLAAEGQPAQLEMLFAQSFHHVEPPTAEWLEILANRNLFLSKRAILPFLRFAEAQAHKAVLKGENLEKIQTLLAWAQSVQGAVLAQSIRESVEQNGRIGPVAFHMYVNESGATLIEIAGRAFDVATPIKRFIDTLKTMEKKYGTRSRLAASVGVDWKSIHHALRLTYEAENLLKSGELSLPFQGEHLRLLKAVKEGLLPDFDWSLELKNRLSHLGGLVADSALPDIVDTQKLEELHYRILWNHTKSEL